MENPSIRRPSLSEILASSAGYLFVVYFIGWIYSVSYLHAFRATWLLAYFDSFDFLRASAFPVTVFAAFLGMLIWSRSPSPAAPRPNPPLLAVLAPYLVMGSGLLLFAIFKGWPTVALLLALLAVIWSAHQLIVYSRDLRTLAPLRVAWIATVLLVVAPWLFGAGQGGFDKEPKTSSLPILQIDGVGGTPRALLFSESRIFCVDLRFPHRVFLIQPDSVRSVESPGHR